MLESMAAVKKCSKAGRESMIKDANHLKTLIEVMADA